MKKCRSKCTLIIGIIFMTASLCFVLYPSASNAVNSFFAAGTINNYAASLDSISAADRSQYLSAAAEYNNNLSELVNVFSYDTDSVIDGYDDILNFGDGLIGYIDISLLSVDEEKDLLSLITCYPYGINSHRLIVTAERVSETASPDTAIKAETNNRSFDFILLAIIAIAITAVIATFAVRKRRKNNA